MDILHILQHKNYGTRKLFGTFALISIFLIIATITNVVSFMRYTFVLLSFLFFAWIPTAYTYDNVKHVPVRFSHGPMTLLDIFISY